MLNVLQVGLGDLGRRTVSDLQSSRLGRVIAAVDAHPALHGIALGEIAPGALESVVVVPTLQDVGPLRSFDLAIVMTRSKLPDCAELFQTLLEAGLTVVSTCEELVWPWLRHPELARELDASAKASGARLLGVGVNPGFLMDAIPGLLSAACLELDSVHVERRIDASKRRPAFQRKVGAGATIPDIEARLAAGTTGHVGLGESLHLLAALCGLHLDSWDEQAEVIGAEEELDSAEGPIPVGGAAGLRQRALGRRGEQVVAELVFDARLSQPDAADEIRLEGRPRLEVRIPGGLHGDLATSALVVHSLQAVLAREPGLRTMGDFVLSRRSATRS